MTRNSDILVLAATGKTGRRVVRNLRAAEVPVRPASRTSPTPFDWSDPTTWQPALTGSRAVYLVAPDEPEPIADFVDTAVAAGVQRLVTLSGNGIEHIDERFGQGMAAAEAAVRASGVEWTIVRANNFLQNFSEDLWLDPLRSGRLALPVGGALEPFVDVEDVAAVAAAVLVEPGHAGRVYGVSGPRRVGFGEAVEVISAAAGRPIVFEDITPEQYRDDLRAAGQPEAVVEAMDSLFGLLRAGHLSGLTDGVQQVLGRAPGSIEEWAGKTAPSGVWDLQV
ncbi:NAD(P)H-binding protein [Nocardia transvalensis]|uniref:NAD(P)H-binding protein n=1 Tax=Nocardia transvalensis TaxID=37333 RepID=UPI001893D547|nr:NAD(P)H-binding protein [Nocardia transvalensis]MBF6326980.1 NAD(P)H-binding protein [Nocardia transvalensis]